MVFFSQPIVWNIGLGVLFGKPEASGPVFPRSTSIHAITGVSNADGSIVA
jgi:hypothetical protein